MKPLQKLTLCGLALTLASCAPAVVRTSDARLSAQASTPYGPFTFDCNPALNARRSGVTLAITDSNSFSCPSLDGRATLALTVYRMEENVRQPFVRYVGPPNQPPVYRPMQPTLRPSKTVTHIVLVVPGVNGAPPLSFSGEADSQNADYWNLFNRAGVRGSFSSNLGGGVSVQGSFNLISQ